jgi:hypothetical protein
MATAGEVKHGPHHRPLPDNGGKFPSSPAKMPNCQLEALFHHIGTLNSQIEVLDLCSANLRSSCSGGSGTYGPEARHFGGSLGKATRRMLTLRRFMSRHNLRSFLNMLLLIGKDHA